MPSLWSEHRTPEGRLYWSNAETKQSVWEKPDELRTAFEKELAKTDWKQYTSKDKPYYVNSVTKETKWELPDELEEMKKRLEAAEQATPEPASASPLPSSASAPGSADTGTVALVPPTVPGRTFLPLYPTAVTRFSPASVPTGPKRELPPKWPVGGFLTHDKAEDAFFKLLKYEGVDEHSTWEETMRKIITHELYKALDTLAMKKAAFVKYQHKIVEDRQLAKESRVARMRPVLRALFESRPEEIKAWSTVKTANRVFEGERQWRTAFEDEREAILTEYTKELREKEETAERELKTRNIGKLASLIRSLDSIHIGTRWRQAHDLVVSSDSFKADDELQQIDTIDMMGVYDEYMRQLEGGQEEDARRYRVKMARVARKARDGYRALMAEMAESGELTMDTKWKEMYEKIKDEPRYLALLGQPGSGPLELWMDAVDDLAEETYLAADKLDKAFKTHLSATASDGEASGSGVNGAAPANGDAAKTETADNGKMEVDGEEGHGEGSGKNGESSKNGTTLASTTTSSSSAADAARPGKVSLDTSFSTFQSWVTTAHMASHISPIMQKRVYDMHIARLKQIAADDARRAERKRRHRIDDLRYALKGVSRHIELDMKFEEAVPFMEGLKEWGEVKEEEGRREAFERFIRRQKEKLEERERYEKRHSRSRYSEEYEDRRPSKSGRHDEEDEREKEREKEKDSHRERAKEDERESKRPKLSYKDIEEGEI